MKLLSGRQVSRERFGDRESKVKILSVAAVAIGLLASGCASHKYVNTKISDLGASQSARSDGIEGLAREALGRANAAHKLAEGKFVYSVTLSDETAHFKTSKYDLSPEAKAKLSALANQLITENKNVYIEIQGHTDSTGSDAVNQNLGMMRAEAVRLFLNQNGVALNRMSAISYRDTMPVASNTSRKSRALNRRVVLIVMS